jgi:soluble lytic murein transglycosylase-like protein
MPSAVAGEARTLALVAEPAPRKRRQRETSAAPVSSHRASVVHSVLFGLLSFALMLALVALQRTGELREENAQLRAQLESRLQQLDAGIRADSRRQQLLLGIRNEILAVNPSLGAPLAYDYAASLVTACEKYPSVDPVLLLAIGTVESRFTTSATSHARARGVYQILPSTGRMLAGMLGWQYGDELLHDAAKNTTLAALYLHVLFTAYRDESLVLAEYNGGPLNAGYIRAGGGRASPETRSYVAKVLELRRRLAKKLEQGNDVITLATRNEPALRLTYPHAVAAGAAQPLPSRQTGPVGGGTSMPVEKGTSHGS